MNIQLRKSDFIIIIPTCNGDIYQDDDDEHTQLMSEYADIWGYFNQTKAW